MFKEISKLLSYVLRHAPQSIGMTLDAQGWVDVDELLARIGPRLDRETLFKVVAESDKQRFTLSPDRRRIRAAQGHSVEVDLDLTPREPPALLFHGTAEKSLKAILAEGLKPGRRQKVHLSRDVETALKVGRRHGEPAVLEVDAAAMHAEGRAFWEADNGVWLTDAVPPGFLRLRAHPG